MNVEDAVRIRKKYRGRYLYIIVSFRSNGFISSVTYSQSADPENTNGDRFLTTAGMKLVERLLTELCKTSTIDELITFCRESVITLNDLPTITAEALETAKEEHNKEDNRVR